MVAIRFVLPPHLREMHVHRAPRLLPAAYCTCTEPRAYGTYGRRSRSLRRRGSLVRVAGSLGRGARTQCTGRMVAAPSVRAQVQYPAQAVQHGSAAAGGAGRPIAARLPGARGRSQDHLGRLVAAITAPDPSPP